MASLTNTELSKFRNGTYRWQHFKEKLQNNERFELTPGTQKRFGFCEKVSLEPISEDFYNLVDKGLETGTFTELANCKFWCNELNAELGLTNLQKTEEFGRSGGTSGGTEQTKQVEALTSILCSIKAGGTSHCNSDVDFSKVAVDQSWYPSVSSTVETIVDSEYVSSFPDYHYQDDFVQTIQKTYLKLRKGTRFATKQFNKWNPADIWISSGSIGPLDFEDCSSLDELSRLCYSQWCRGISLKKGGTGVKVVDSNEFKQWEVERYRLLTDLEATQGYTLRLQFNFIGGKEKLLTIRPNGTAFRVEIQTLGSTHRNGSCGQTQLNACLRACKVGYRFDLSKAIQKKSLEKYNRDERIRIEARNQLKRFVVMFKKQSEKVQREVIADITRHCVCQSREHCTYLKVS